MKCRVLNPIFFYVFNKNTWKEYVFLKHSQIFLVSSSIKYKITNIVTNNIAAEKISQLIFSNGKSEVDDKIKNIN